VEELLERPRAERARKTALVEEQRAVECRHCQRRSVGDDLVTRLNARAEDLRRHLGVHVARTRQLFSAILAGPVVMVPGCRGGAARLPI
jgi:hypothetical protein